MAIKTQHPAHAPSAGPNDYKQVGAEQVTFELNSTYATATFRLKRGERGSALTDRVVESLQELARATGGSLHAVETVTMKRRERLA